MIESQIVFVLKKKLFPLFLLVITRYNSNNPIPSGTGSITLLPGPSKTCVAYCFVFSTRAVKHLLQRCEMVWILLEKTRNMRTISTVVCENEVEYKVCQVELTYHKSITTMHTHQRAKHPAERGGLSTDQQSVASFVTGCHQKYDD